MLRDFVRRAGHLASVGLLLAMTALPASAEEVNPEVDLGIDKSVSAASAVPGDTLVYTLTVSNAGPFAAVAVHAVDTLPAGVTFVAATEGCTHAGGVVECLAGTAGIMFPDDISVHEITVVIDEGATGDLRNVATVENRENPETGPVDPNPGNNSDDAVTTLPSPPELGTIGDFVWNDLDGDGVQDAGEPGIGDVEVVVAGPDGPVNAVTDAAGAYLVTDLPAGQYEVTVEPDSVPSGLTATTPPTVTVDLGEGQAFLDADFGFVDQAAPSIDLELTKTADPALVTAGATTTFTISLINQGPDTATGVVVGDVLPAGLTFVGSAGDGAYEPAAGTWNVGTLAVGATAVLDLTVRAEAPGSFENRAEVIAAAEPDVDSTPGDGVGDDFDSAVVDAVQISASAQIGDTVWNDLDADGVQDAGEPGIAGVTVTLLLPGGGTDARVTDVSGKYLFAALEAGTYTARVETATVDDDLGLTTAASFSVTLVDDGVFLDADFGFAEILPATGLGSAFPAAVGLLLVAVGLVLIVVTRPAEAGLGRRS